MSKFRADTMTSNTTPYIHAGSYQVTSNITMNETASGSVTIALMLAPAGKRITDFTYITSGTDGTGGEGLVVTVDGKTLINSSVGAPFLRASAPSSSALGVELTSDATVTLRLTACVGTGTVSQVIRTITTLM